MIIMKFFKTREIRELEGLVAQTIVEEGEE
jgi:hypothetical protein